MAGWCEFSAAGKFAPQDVGVVSDGGLVPAASDLADCHRHLDAIPRRAVDQPFDANPDSGMVVGINSVAILPVDPETE